MCKEQSMHAEVEFLKLYQTAGPDDLKDAYFCIFL